jgi:hypothetical protein
MEGTERSQDRLKRLLAKPARLTQAWVRLVVVESGPPENVASEAAFWIFRQAREWVSFSDADVD